MAQMTLSDIQTQVQDYIPNKLAAAITRAANMALREMYRVAGPTKRFTFSTTAPYTTGTVAVTRGSTGVTLTGGTFAASSDKQLIQIEGDRTWFTFTRTGGTTGTLGSAWAAANDATATFTLAYAFVELPTDILSVSSLWMPDFFPLDRISEEQYARWMGGAQSTGYPRQYALGPAVTAGSSALRAELIPFPDATYAMTAAGQVRPTLVASSGDYSGLPEEYDDTWLSGTLMYAWDQEAKDERSAYWRNIFKAGLTAMAANRNRGFIGALQEGFGDDAVAGPWNRWPIGG